MRLVLISDTHMKHSSLKIPDGDILIHAGDMTRSGDPGDVIRFNAWLGTLPHKSKIVIAGNHDFCFQRDPAARNLITNAIYLQDSGVVIEEAGHSVRIWGSPWQPWFYDWAFNVKRGKLIKEKWDLIPQGDDAPDVLVTHGPPHGIPQAKPAPMALNLWVVRNCFWLFSTSDPSFTSLVTFTKDTECSIRMAFNMLMLLLVPLDISQAIRRWLSMSRIDRSEWLRFRIIRLNRLWPKVLDRPYDDLFNAGKFFSCRSNGG